MQDRVPLYPGRVKLNPVAGQDNTFDMVRADEPIQPGTPLNKETLLKDVTASILGLPNTAVPDDAFLALIIGVGTHGYRVKIKLEDGTPVEGATVRGIEPLTGSTLVSGADGIVLGKSTKASVTISCTSPYVDQEAPSSQDVTATGTITDVTMTLNRAGIVKITSSKIVKISHLPKTVDITAVGGGGGGGGAYSVSYGDAWLPWGGGGGGGGNVTHALNVKLIEQALEISVGAGGSGAQGAEAPGRDGGSGGVTSIKFQGEPQMIVSASGGGGGYGQNGSAIGGTSTNGGRGGRGGYTNKDNTFSGGENGSDCTEHIFGDAALDIAGGGGGVRTGSNLAGDGGHPNGGKGGYSISAEYNAPISGKAPGGGGGGHGIGRKSFQSAGNGGMGGVYLRFHF